MELLLGKFDIFSYEKKGIVLAHFPLHHYRFRNYIQIYWSKYKWFTLFEMLLPSRSERGLQPLKQIAFYHGIQIGFYFAFFTSFTSFMMPLALYGLFAQIHSMIDSSMRSKYLPFTSLATSIWMAGFLEL